MAARKEFIKDATARGMQEVEERAKAAAARVVKHAARHPGMFSEQADDEADDDSFDQLAQASGILPSSRTTEEERKEEEAAAALKRRFEEKRRRALEEKQQALEEKQQALEEERRRRLAEAEAREQQRLAREARARELERVAAEKERKRLEMEEARRRAAEEEARRREAERLRVKRAREEAAAEEARLQREREERLKRLEMERRAKRLERRRAIASLSAPSVAVVSPDEGEGAEASTEPNNLYVATGPHWLTDSCAVPTFVVLEPRGGHLPASSSVVGTDCGVVIWPCSAAASVAVNKLPTVDEDTEQTDPVLFDPATGSFSNLMGTVALEAVRDRFLWPVLAWLPPTSEGFSYGSCLVALEHDADEGGSSVVLSPRVFSFKSRGWLDSKWILRGHGPVTRSASLSGHTLCTVWRHGSPSPSVVRVGGTRSDGSLSDTASVLDVHDDGVGDHDCILESHVLKAPALVCRGPAVPGESRPWRRSLHAAVGTTDGSVVVFGGMNESGKCSNVLWRFDPDTGVWKAFPPMTGTPPTPRVLASLHMYSGALVVVGGYHLDKKGNLHQLDDAHVLSLRSRRWHPLTIAPHPVTDEPTPVGGNAGCLIEVGETPVIVCGGPATSLSTRSGAVQMLHLAREPLEDLSGMLSKFGPAELEG
jgi:hypothetical protein